VGEEADVEEAGLSKQHTQFRAAEDSQGEAEGFGPAILEAAKAKGCARLAFKGLAHQKWPKDDPDRKKYSKCWYQPLTDPEEAKLCLRWTLSQPVTAAITPGEESLMRVALEVAANFRPTTAKEVEEVKKLASKAVPIFPT
jgi:hypothetical protein